MRAFITANLGADFAAPPPEQQAEVQLTVGDHSGSYSERWVLHVGERNFQGHNSVDERQIFLKDAFLQACKLAKIALN